MTYSKIFNPKPIQISGEYENPGDGRGDYNASSNYVYSDEIILAVNVALATGRPLLVRGDSGTGKSALARSVADVLDLPLFETVITSQTQARQLLWDVDMLRRLQDAQVGELKPEIKSYVKPGTFWWAFDPEGAHRQLHGSAPDQPPRGDGQSVILIDEIDKADPDLPNNLLVPIGSLCFTVEETGDVIKSRKPPVVIITSNDERELPSAFLRRCVEIRIATFNKAQLVSVGKAHFGEQLEDGFLEAVADLALSLHTDSGDPQAEQSRTSPAEYLDALRSCHRLNISAGSADWKAVSEIIFNEHDR
jgi:MoxR-like ATPase